MNEISFRPSSSSACSASRKFQTPLPAQPGKHILLA
jgi:hypothetical protein